MGGGRYAPSAERRALGEIPADRETGSAGGVDYLFSFEKLFVEKCRDRVLPPRLAGAGQFVGQIAAFEVEDAVGQRAAPSAFDERPNPAREGRHVGHGARDDVVEPLRELLGTAVARFEVGDARPFGHGAHHGDLLADRVDGRKTCLGEEDRQRHRGEAPSAADVEHPRAGREGADAGDGQRVEHVAQVELIEILARDDVDAGVPLGVERPERGELFALARREIGEIAENGVHVAVGVIGCRFRRSGGTCVRGRGGSAS